MCLSDVIIPKYNFFSLFHLFCVILSKRLNPQVWSFEETNKHVCLHSEVESESKSQCVYACSQ